VVSGKLTCEVGNIVKTRVITKVGSLSKMNWWEDNFYGQEKADNMQSFLVLHTAKNMQKSQDSVWFSPFVDNLEFGREKKSSSVTKMQFIYFRLWKFLPQLIYFQTSLNAGHTYNSKKGLLRMVASYSKMFMFQSQFSLSKGILRLEQSHCTRPQTFLDPV